MTDQPNDPNQENEEETAADSSTESEGDAVPTQTEGNDDVTTTETEAGTPSDSAEVAAHPATPEQGDEEANTEPTLPEPTNPNFRWFVVHTYSMYEEKAKIALLDRISRYGMEAKFGEIFVPKTAHEQVLKSGKRKTVERTSFPGYILVEMEMSDETNHIVRDTPKVTGFVGNARRPRPITDKEVLRLTAPEALQEQTKVEASTQSFEKGETVKVIDGAFTNFDGVVEAVQAEKMKLRILVSIFGRETPVELEYAQVQKID